LLGTTLLLTNVMHFTVLEAALGIAPGPIAAGISSPFSGRLSTRVGVRRILLLGAGLFGAAAGWPLIVAASGAAPTYAVSILPSLILWGAGNACIQPTLFAGADAAPRDDLSLATAVLAASRQLGAALGVAMLVGLLAFVGTGAIGFQLAWGIVFLSAICTALAGLFATSAPARDRAGSQSSTAMPSISISAAGSASATTCTESSQRVLPAHVSR
jgi:MFS family permease